MQAYSRRLRVFTKGPLLKRQIIVAFAWAALGVALLSYTWHAAPPADYYGFRTGGLLLPFPAELYSLHAAERIAGEIHPIKPHYPFIRLPWVAAAHRPLALLPRKTAEGVWLGICLAGGLAFVVLWPGRKDYALIAACWSIPLVAAFVVGQDVPLFLGVFAGSCALLIRGRHFAAGLLLALCTAKFHLLILFPVLLIRKRLWRYAAGFVTGGAALIALSCAAAGTGWISSYLLVISHPAANLWVDGRMWNFRAIFPQSVLLEVLAGVLLAVFLWLRLPRLDLLAALSVTLAAGVLVSHHSYISDAALTLPVLLLVSERFQMSPPAWLAILLLTPIPYVLWMCSWPANGPWVIAIAGLIAAATSSQATLKDAECMNSDASH